MESTSVVSEQESFNLYHGHNVMRHDTFLLVGQKLSFFQTDFFGMTVTLELCDYVKDEKLQRMLIYSYRYGLLMHFILVMLLLIKRGQSLYLLAECTSPPVVVCFKHNNRATIA